MADDQNLTQTIADDAQVVDDSQAQIQEITESGKPEKVTEGSDQQETKDAADQTEPVAETVSEEAPNEEQATEPLTNTEVISDEEVKEPVDTEPKDTETAAETSTTEESSMSSANDNPNARWYVVHTYSGHENKVATTLKQKIETERLENKILDVLVPVQEKIEIKGGKRATVKEKIFPGYILVKMVLDDVSWVAVRTTQGVTSFVGIGNKPTPISEKEVQTIVAFTKNTEPVYKQVFMANDTVKIVEGPFAEFIGKVDSVDEERGKVRVLVSIFGRETPVELDFLQVQKI